MLSTLGLPRRNLHQHRSPLQPRIADQYGFDGWEVALQDVYPIMGPTARRICEGETMVEKKWRLTTRKVDCRATTKALAARVINLLAFEMILRHGFITPIHCSFLECLESICSDTI